MRLWDVLDRTVRLTQRVFLRGAIIALLTMLPAGLIVGFACREFFAGVTDAIQIAGASRISESIDAALPIYYAFIEVAIAGVFFMFAMAMMVAAMVDVADAEVHNEPRSWQAAFARAWRNAFAIFGQYVVRGFLVFGAFFVVTGLSAAHKGLLAFLVLSVGTCLCVWLINSWAFGGQVVVCEQQGLFGGLARSTMLVKRRWWQVFWYLVFVGLCVQFIFTLVRFPLFWFMMAPVAVRLQEIHIGNLQGMREKINALFPILRSLGWAIGFMLGFNSSLTLIIKSAYKTVMYFDLREQPKVVSPIEHPDKEGTQP